MTTDLLLYTLLGFGVLAVFPSYVGLLSKVVSFAYFSEKYRFHVSLAQAHGAPDNSDEEE